VRRGPAVPRALATLYAAYGDLLDTRTWPRKVAMFRTGGNSGIGVETARALASAGAKVILTSRKVAAGEAVVASLKEAGVKASDPEKDLAWATPSCAQMRHVCRRSWSLLNCT